MESTGHVIIKHFNGRCTCDKRVIDRSLPQPLISDMKCATTSSDESSEYEDDLWSGSDEIEFSAITVESDPNEPSRLEQHLYYAGVRGPKGRAPRLVWRDSSDTFEEPSGPEAYRRLMNVIPVQDDHKFGDKVSEGVILWDVVRNHVGDFLFMHQFLR